MKKIVYIALVIFLGLLISFIGHAIFEIAYLKYAFAKKLQIQGSYFLGIGWCALPVWIQYSFPVIGIVGGYFLALRWWEIVYVRKMRWKFFK